MFITLISQSVIYLIFLLCLSFLKYFFLHNMNYLENYLKICLIFCSKRELPVFNLLEISKQESYKLNIILS